jgi:hypothetical protein
MLAPDQSFLVEGETSLSRGQLQFIVMEPVDKDQGETVLITCIQVDGDLRVFPATFTSTQPGSDSGFEPIFDEIWMKPLVTDNAEDPSSSKEAEGPYSVNHPGGAQLRPGQGFWNAFFDCLLRTVPGDVLGCLVTCIILPVGFPICFAACSSGVGLADLINCAIFAYQVSGKEKQEQPQ